jgi:hypothetical protein
MTTKSTQPPEPEAEDQKTMGDAVGSKVHVAYSNEAPQTEVPPPKDAAAVGAREPPASSVTSPTDTAKNL